MNDICLDNRFKLIEKYKKRLIKATNIETSPEEMAVLDDILFRFWQMGWLDRLEMPVTQQWTSCSEGTPKKTSYYICTCHDGVCYRTSVLKWSTGWVLTGARSYWKVIAWMPLPEPYKGEEE